VLESIVVFGVSDHPAVTQTYDIVRARTGADTLFATGFFPTSGKVGQGDRKAMCKMLDNAVKWLWDKIGVGASADGKGVSETPVRSPIETAEFAKAHPRLLDAVRFIYEHDEADEERGTKFKPYATPGYAAAMFYLMATSATDGDAYRKAFPRGEEQVDFSRWDKAEEFWLGLKGTSPGFKNVRLAKYPYPGDPPNEGLDLNYSGRIFPAAGSSKPGGSAALKWTTLAKAWNLFVDGGEAALTDRDMAVDFMGVQRYDSSSGGASSGIWLYPLSSHPLINFLNRKT
jgi:hypothetical protein